MMIKNSNEDEKNNNLTFERRTVDNNFDDEYRLNEVALVKHNFLTDYDRYKCPDCDGLGYFYFSPPELGGLSTYLFPKKECNTCCGKGYIDLG